MVNKQSNLQALISKRKILPLTKKIRANIDTLYVQYVGPVGATVCDDYFSQWREEGNVGPGDLVQYIKLISVEIPRLKKRDEFERSAIKLIRLIT